MSDSQKPSDPYKNFFENFVFSLGMAILLLKNANKDENLFEAIILYASIIDAILRNLIAIKTGQPMTDGGLELDPCFFYHDKKNGTPSVKFTIRLLKLG
jgi:hypothetical protein